jgi:uroporphyrinogen decarboxylase
LRWTRQLIAALPKNYPVILYAKGAAPSPPSAPRRRRRRPRLDSRPRRRQPALLPANVAVQGNLDPVL